MQTPQQRWEPAERAALLGAVRLFRSLPPPLQLQIAGHFRVRRLQRGEFAFLEGAPAAELNLLAEGRIKVVRETEDGREVILRQISPGEIFGGAGGWGEAAYPASAVAQDDAVVLRLPAREFRALLEREPAFALAVIEELGVRLREAEARIRDLQSERVERRLARALLRLAQRHGRRRAADALVEVTVSRQDLAELAGATLSTASRTLSAWDERGIVVASREHVAIRDPAALAALADDDAAASAAL